MTLDRSVDRPLAVGDLVVYASHGVGRVESTEPSRDDVPATLTLVFDGGLRVTLPLARARDALRPLSGPDELEDVRRTLGADVSPTIEPWSSRHRTIRETVAAGGVTGLAAIVRDGLQRERRVTAGVMVEVMGFHSGTGPGLSRYLHRGRASPARRGAEPPKLATRLPSSGGGSPHGSERSSAAFQTRHATGPHSGDRRARIASTTTARLKVCCAPPAKPSKNLPDATITVDAKDKEDAKLPKISQLQLRNLLHGRIRFGGFDDPKTTLLEALDQLTR